MKHNFNPILSLFLLAHLSSIPLSGQFLATELLIQDETISGTQNYLAQQHIFAGREVDDSRPAGDIIVAPGSEVAMRAGEKIVLSAGFHAQAGSSFRAVLGDSYSSRKKDLPDLIQEGYFPDHCDEQITPVTELDMRSFEALNNLQGPNLLDNANGWSVVARTGGRPFRCFDQITINWSDWIFDPADFSPGSSEIPQSELDAHFNAGKSVNRLWLIHQAEGNSYPTVVVLTPDGFLNLGGATSPKLQGAAIRTGFIGEPFGGIDGLNDYIQHTDELSIIAIDDNTLILLYNIHSEAGEGVLEIRLVWNDVDQVPELSCRIAQAPRIDAELGFVGINFMRGPTFFGLPTIDCLSSAGLDAYHDGRSAILLFPNGDYYYDGLIPPVQPDIAFRENLAGNIGIGTQLIMDQPQEVNDYFSRLPTPGYESRTDLIVALEGSNGQEVKIKKAQTAVNLYEENPEANETVNLFFASDLFTDQISEFSFHISLDDADFENLYPIRQTGVAFVSDRYWEHGNISFLPLDDNFQIAGPVRTLTDGIIKDPNHLKASFNGRFLLFDADDDHSGKTNQRIYQLDLLRSTVERLTVDPFGSGSFDIAPTSNADHSSFAFTTNRQGTPTRINIQSIASGLSCGIGTAIITGADPDWSPTQDELVFTTPALQLIDLNTNNVTTLINSPVASPRFSPDGALIAYHAGNAVYTIQRDGSNDQQLLTNAAHPSWLDADHLIVEREIDGEIDLYLLDIETQSLTPLTPIGDGINASQPAVVKPFNAISSIHEAGVSNPGVVNPIGKELPSLHQIMPNPSIGHTTLHYYVPSDFQEASVQLISIAGVVLQQYQLDVGSKSTLKISTNFLESGYYFLRLMADNQIYGVMKIVVADD